MQIPDPRFAGKEKEKFAAENCGAFPESHLIQRLQPISQEKNLIARTVPRRILKRGPQRPGRKFLVPNPSKLALRYFSARHRNNILEDTLPHLVNHFPAFEDRARVNVHVFVHVIEKRRVGGHFDAWRWLATVNAPASCLENANVAPAGDKACHAYRV